MRLNQAVATFGLALVAVLSGSAARADTVDGDWCSQTDSRSFTIHGPQIVTPGKQQVVGVYTRHHFSYVVPDGEADAGQAVEMQLLNEENILVKVGDGEAATWRRCEVIS